MKKINITLNSIEEIDLTAEEISKRAAEVSEFETEKQAEETARTAKATAQASGNTKLLDLGLTQSEATALTGYTIPVSEEDPE